MGHDGHGWRERARAGASFLLTLGSPGSGAPAPRTTSRARQALVDAVLLLLMLVNATLRGQALVLATASVVLAVALWLPLPLLRSRAPAACLALTLLTDGTWVVLAPPGPGTVSASGAAALGVLQPAPLACAAAALTLAARTPLHVGGPVAGGAGLVLLAVGVTARGTADLSACLLTLTVLVMAGTTGTAVASWRMRSLWRRERREREVIEAVLAERLRIARDLHDGLAHRLTLVNAQAGVAAHLLAARPDEARQALAGITEQTRAAVDDLRATLTVLRDDDVPAGQALSTSREPAPGAASLAALVASHRDAGARVSLEVLGESRPVPAAVDHSTYRIVQEALTNAAKHAPGAAVSVSVQWREDTLFVRVVDEGRPRPAGARTAPPARPSLPGTGNGLVGMHERADAVGARLHAGPLPDGGWAVNLDVPLSTSRTRRST